MARPLILGKLDPDLACALALGFVEHNFIVVNRDFIQFHDADDRELGRQDDWLTEEDPLDQATRAYLDARIAAHQAGHVGQEDNAWAAAEAGAAREEANRMAIAARATGRALLEERKVLQSAKAAGMTVLGA